MPKKVHPSVLCDEDLLLTNSIAAFVPGVIASSWPTMDVSFEDDAELMVTEPPLIKPVDVVETV